MSAEYNEKLSSFLETLKVLSNRNAYILFIACSDGLEADTNAFQRLGLTRKQYYTRLSRLKDANLVDKKNGQWVYTALGRELRKELDKTYEKYGALYGDLGKLSPENLNHLLKYRTNLDKLAKMREEETASVEN